MSTSGYGGKTLKKSIVVHTNEASNPRLNFSVSGQVNKFVTIAPKSVKLTGPVGKKIQRTVTITLEEKYPFNILGTSVRDGKNIKFKLEDSIRLKPRGYLLTVENLKEEKGRYFDTISLKTDSAIQPLIHIRVYGNILDDKAKQKK